MSKRGELASAKNLLRTAARGSFAICWTLEAIADFTFWARSILGTLVSSLCFGGSSLWGLFSGSGFEGSKVGYCLGSAVSDGWGSACSAYFGSACSDYLGSVCSNGFGSAGSDGLCSTGSDG